MCTCDYKGEKKEPSIISLYLIKKERKKRLVSNLKEALI